MPYTDYSRKDRPEEEIALQPRLLHVGFETTEPAWYNLEHSHHTCELLHLLDGAESAIIGGERYEISAGDTIIFDTGVAHQEWGDGRHTRNVIVCTFDEFQLAGLPKNHLIDESVCPVIRSCADSEVIDLCFRRLYQESTMEGHYSYTMSNLLLQEIIILLLRNIHMEKESRRRYLSECERIRQYMDEHFCEKITLDDIARQFYVSKGHLTHIFREQTGDTPISYLIQKRIDLAMKLLMETEASVQEIAEQTGYSNPVYFCQSFSKRTGLSPSQYRKRMRR